ncbi:MAG: hypothetical protein Q9175_004332 [Cornicularia normoerica]
MKPEDAYLCAIEFMYELATSGWEGLIPSGFEAFSKQVNGLKIAFGSLAQPEDKYQLQNKHVILGLLKTMNTLASRQTFCTTKAALYMYTAPVGHLVIGRPIVPTLAEINDTNVTVSNINSFPSSTMSRRLATVKEIVDPEDSDFVILYEMLGDPIPCQILLNAAVNGLAKSAQAKNDDRCTDFAGLSSGGEVTYMFSRNPPRTTLFVLSYGLIRASLRLLPARMYSEESCGEVKFDFVYRGEELGGGSIFLS